MYMKEPYVAIFEFRCSYSPMFPIVKVMNENVVKISASGDVEEMEAAISRALQLLLWVVWAAIIC